MALTALSFAQGVNKTGEYGAGRFFKDWHLHRRLFACRRAPFVVMALAPQIQVVQNFSFPNP
jgi:hypothetical protein